MSRISPIVQEISGAGTPESVVASIGASRGVQLLRSNYFEAPHARYSFVVARPFLTFSSSASHCVIETRDGATESFGNPWHLLDEVMSQYELLDEVDHPFPLGGCFGFWGYDLKNFVEPKLKRRAVNDLEIPDAWVGFYSSVLVFDHHVGKVWIVATGLDVDGTRTAERCAREIQFWKDAVAAGTRERTREVESRAIRSNVTREQFITAVQKAQDYIQHGHIYQVNLSQRLTAAWDGSGWDFFLRLKEVSPAPFSAYLHCGEFELASSSPELFLRMSGSQIRTRPIKGTRPRHADPTRDAQLSYELQTSAKEISELVMITDLLRNDLGRVCEYGSVQVPDLVRLEKYPHVQHLVSTVEGRLRDDVTHFRAFSSCFPGGSITGAPKFRAMEIIDELEPLSRGPYTGALGYLGFNRETQLSIIIRTGLVKDGEVHFNVGAGIVADSVPEAEYDETLAKAGGLSDATSKNRRINVLAP
ncbi:MAG TPA: aminodeoxychorismate synthase component I [Verrucomicrobiae bacterium]